MKKNIAIGIAFVLLLCGCTQRQAINIETTSSIEVTYPECIAVFHGTITINEEPEPLDLYYYKESNQNYSCKLAVAGQSKTIPLRDDFMLSTITRGFEIQDVNQDGKDDILIELGIYGKARSVACFVDITGGGFVEVTDFRKLFIPHWSSASGMVVDEWMADEGEFGIDHYVIEVDKLILAESLVWEYKNGNAPVYTESRNIDGEMIVIQDCVSESKLDLDYWYQQESTLASERQRQRYLDALGVDLADYIDTRIFYNNKIYVFCAPVGVVDFNRMHTVGYLTYDKTFPSKDFITDCVYIDEYEVLQLSGGIRQDALCISGDAYCDFLYVLEDEHFSSEYEYEENEDGGITILKYYGNATHVTVPSEIDGKKVTAIEGIHNEGAFANCPSVVSVSLPEGVTKLGNCTFYSCYNLQTVYFPASIRELGSCVFYMCPQVTEIHFDGDAPNLRGSLFERPIPELNLEHPVEFYPNGLDLTDVQVFYREKTNGWDRGEWECFSMISN